MIVLWLDVDFVKEIFLKSIRLKTLLSVSLFQVFLFQSIIRIFSVSVSVQAIQTGKLLVTAGGSEGPTPPRPNGYGSTRAWQLDWSSTPQVMDSPTSLWTKFLLPNWIGTLLRLLSQSRSGQSLRHLPNTLGAKNDVTGDLGSTSLKPHAEAVVYASTTHLPARVVRRSQYQYCILPSGRHPNNYQAWCY